MIDAVLTPTDSQTGLKIGHIMFICIVYTEAYSFYFHLFHSILTRKPGNQDGL